MKRMQAKTITLVTSPKDSGLSVSLPVILAAGRSVSGTSAPDLQKTIEQATDVGVLVTRERPLTPDELGMVPGPGFAEAIREVLSKTPDLLVDSTAKKG